MPTNKTKVVKQKPKGLYIYCVATKTELKKLSDVDKHSGSIVPVYMDIEKCSDGYIEQAGSRIFIQLKESIYKPKNKL